MKAIFTFYSIVQIRTSAVLCDEQGIRDGAKEPIFKVRGRLWIRLKRCMTHPD